MTGSNGDPNIIRHMQLAHLTSLPLIPKERVVKLLMNIELYESTSYTLFF